MWPNVFHGHTLNLKVTQNKNQRFESNSSKIIRPVTHINSLRFALFNMKQKRLTLNTIHAEHIKYIYITRKRTFSKPRPKGYTTPTYIGNCILKINCLLLPWHCRCGPIDPINSTNAILVKYQAMKIIQRDLIRSVDQLQRPDQPDNKNIVMTPKFNIA